MKQSKSHLFFYHFPLYLKSIRLRIQTLSIQTNAQNSVVSIQQIFETYLNFKTPKKTNFFHILVCYYLLHVSLNKQAAQKGKVIFSYKHTRKRKNKTVLPSNVFAVVVTERHNWTESEASTDRAKGTQNQESRTKTFNKRKLKLSDKKIKRKRVV